MKKTTDEFQQFDTTMRRLLKVPHSKLKAELDSEKAAKKGKTKRRVKSDNRDAQHDRT